MPYDENKMLGLYGGWGILGERTIARWYTMYATIIQCRSWLPDEVGGIVWLAQDNAATSIYVPVYAGVTDLPETFKTPGRPDGYSMKSAWWAFNRLGTLSSQRWGDMRHDVAKVWGPMQKELFEAQINIDNHASRLEARNPKEAKRFLTDYTIQWGDKVVDEAIRLGDFLWTKYDEKF